MKKIFYLLVFIISMFSISAFQLVEKDIYRFPGTVKIVDNFYFDVHEISNLSWKEYLSWMEEKEGKDSPFYQAAYPDTLVWMNKEYTYGEPFMNNYFQHPAYDNYPLVGVSYQQANDYCAWRTERVKEMFKANKVKFSKNFKYRLPSALEWDLIARAEIKEDKYREVRRRKRKENFSHWNLFNMRSKSRDLERKNNPHLAQFEYSSSTAPVSSYIPNTYGVHHLYGNVAEMVAEEGIAKGGSFIDYYEEIYPSGKDASYTKPTHWLGFRCVCEVMD